MKIKPILLFLTLIAISLSLALFIITIPFNNKLQRSYLAKKSVIITDSQNRVIKILPNESGAIAIFQDSFPAGLKQALVRKEDRLFYWHLGINPVSVTRAVLHYLKGDKTPSQSTITQQLAKILLGQGQERSLPNKVKEAGYALALELHTSKDSILSMYLNTAYLGNQAEGFLSAAELYFGKEINSLTDEETYRLLATLNNPTNNNPFTKANSESAKILADRLGLLGAPIDWKESLIDENIPVGSRKASWNKYINNDAFFELSSLGLDPKRDMPLSIDKELSVTIRSIMKKNINNIQDSGAQNGAVVIIKTGPEKKASELLAIVGSPEPNTEAYGYKINMALKPRAIGSTIKPFIYLKGFEKGLRPYTEVEDKEYKYTIGSGFAFYPKNYDYQYHGLVNLHYALSNSLNVPAVKVLEYDGINGFNSFMLDDLKFRPVQDINNYQLGIALGELEMNLLDLSYYFTIFPNEGRLKPLRISEAFPLASANADFSQDKQIAQPEYAQLINRILNDRRTGVEEFGQNSVLNLPFKNFAVKTGTSREFHDSWTIGYTPDFVVGVWVGNAEDRPMKMVSGQTGAGQIWQEVMNLMENSAYATDKQFDFSLVKDYSEDGKIEYGLEGDDYARQKNLLMDKGLIIRPHDQDEFLLSENTSIILEASESVDWSVNGNILGKGEKYIFEPKKTGTYQILSKGIDKEDKISIYVNGE